MARRNQKLNEPETALSPGKRRLKVFKTPVGFHDAYVAAPSRKAALAAWGAGTDLFSAGIAEQVTADKKAMEAALERPGEVLRVARAVPKDDKEGKPSPQPSPARGRERKPSRAAVEKAEAAVADLEKAQAAERAELAKEEAELAKRRRALEARHRKARERAEAKRDAAKERYRETMRDWGG